MTDEAHDAHLRAALRHAPDAQLQPPPALSDLILKEARAKARDAAAPMRAPRHPLLSVWDWLARPSVATGFAGVMVATLVGLMWWDQPMDEAMPRAPAPATAPAQPSSPAEAPPAATQAPAAEAEHADASKRKKEARAPAAAKPVAPAPTPTKPEPANERVAPRPPPREEVAGLTAPPPPAAAAPPAPSVTTQDSAVAGSSSATSVAKSQAADEPKRMRAMAPATDATSNKAGIPTNLDELRQSRVEATPTLAQLRSAVAAEPARWTWQRDGSPPQAVNDTVRSWLARLDGDAGDRWQPVDASVLRAGREIRLLRDGHLQHGFRLFESGVLWQIPQGRWQRVTLPPASLSALETSVQ